MSRGGGTIKGKEGVRGGDRPIRCGGTVKGKEIFSDASVTSAATERCAAPV